MDHSEEAVKEPLIATLQDLASRMEHIMLAPDTTEDKMLDGCRMAVEYGIAACCVRPTDVDAAKRILDGSRVRLASVSGFPHGNASTGAKLYEGRDLLRRGVRELSMVVNIAKLVSRQFQHVETEILQMANSCRENAAQLKIIYECTYLTDEMKIVLSKILKRTETHYAVTSTGFAPGAPYLANDLLLLKQVLRDRVELQANGVLSLDEALALCEAGCARIGSTATEALLVEWKQRLTERATAAAVQSTPSEA